MDGDALRRALGRYATAAGPLVDVERLARTASLVDEARAFLALQNESALLSERFRTFPEALEQARRFLNPIDFGSDRNLEVAERIAAAFIKSQEYAGWWGRFASRMTSERDRERLAYARVEEETRKQRDAYAARASSAEFALAQERALAKEHIAAASANLTILAAEKRQAEEKLLLLARAAACHLIPGMDVATDHATIAKLAEVVVEAEERLAAVVAALDALVAACGCAPGTHCESFGCATLRDIKKIAEAPR